MKYIGLAVYPVKFSLEIPNEVVDMSIEDLRQVIKQQVDDFVQTESYFPVIKIVQCSEPLVVEPL